MAKNGSRNTVHRVVTFLDREQVDLLDRIGKDALFSTGAKFPRTKIIATLINLLRWVEVSGHGIRTERDFEDRLRQAFQKMATEAPHHEAAA